VFVSFRTDETKPQRLVKSEHIHIAEKEKMQTKHDYRNHSVSRYSMVGYALASLSSGGERGRRLAAFPTEVAFDTTAAYSLILSLVEHT
jgi:hypothetical protein